MKIAAMSQIEVIARPQRGDFLLIDQVDVAFEDGAFVRIPAGFVFDGASIPGLLRSLVPTLSTAGSVAFALHDYAYRDGAHYVAPNGNRIEISRQRADWMALAICDWLGLACGDSLRVYAGLRAGGASSYRAKRL